MVWEGERAQSRFLDPINLALGVTNCGIGQIDHQHHSLALINHLCVWELHSICYDDIILRGLLRAFFLETFDLELATLGIAFNSNTLASFKYSGGNLSG